MATLQESKLIEKADRGADLYSKKYKSLVEDFSKYSIVAKARSITPYDVYALGAQLESFQNYKRFLQEAGTASDLGVLPNIALDLITANYGASIAPLVCSVQPIPDEVGTVYFKQIVANQTRGNITAGDVLAKGGFAPAKYARGYAFENVDVELVASTTATDNITGTITGGNIRPHSVVVDYNAGEIILHDDGFGNLIGKGAYGTINYTNGAYDIDFKATLAAGKKVLAKYGTNFETDGNIPKINLTTAKTTIEAEIAVLGTEMSLFKAYSYEKRFGKIAEDEIVNDLTNEITAQIGTRIVAEAEAYAQGTAQWDATPRPGSNWKVHKEELLDVIQRSDTTILDNAGRGSVTAILCGTQAAGIVSNLPTFKSSGVDGLGAHFYGTLKDKIIVIRCPQMTTNKIVALYKGRGYFDAPIVFAPYQPLFVTGTMPSPNNILKREGLAATWTGTKAVVPGYMTNIVINNIPQVV